MNKDDVSIAGIWLFGLLAVGAVIYSIIHIPPQFIQFAGVLVAAVATILVAILTHACAASRERDLEQRKQKTKNYNDLLEKVAPFIRSPPTHQDAMETVHLVSWVIGSPDVIRATQTFLTARNAAALREILIAMRRDIGLPDPPTDLDVKILFQGRTQATLNP